MPQLDAATYRSQVFWLSLIFVSYYLVVLNFLLPSLATRRKTRSKKAALGKGRLSSSDGERTAALASYDGAVASSAVWLTSHLAASVVAANQWRDATVLSTDAASLSSANEAYLAALSSVSAQRMLSANVADEAALAAAEADYSDVMSAE